MATKKKREEQLLKSLRELTALSHNKKCLECQERGPTYADMATHGFVCTSCGGYLRGLNPPHRVKSISMTTFSEQELSVLKEGGNELAHAVWMGRWNPRHDKDPSKKDEVAFKEFLISKYERKQWYRSPADIKREREKENNTPPATETKLLPPPSSKRSAGTAATYAVQPPSSSPTLSTPQPTATPNLPPPTMPTPSTTTETPAASAGGGAAAQKPDLLGGLYSDPFAPKAPPPGAVAVFPPGGVPLLKSTKEGLKPSTGGSDAQSSTATTTGDKYAALASLDVTLKELRVKEEPLPQPSPPTQHNAMPGQQMFGGAGGGGGGGGGSNPFGAPAGVGVQPQPGQQQFNPFAVPQSQPVTGGGVRAVGPGYGGVFQGAPGVMSGGAQQPFQSQQFGAFSGQQMGQANMGQPIQQMGQQPMAQWQQQQPVGQQWGQPQAFPGQMVPGQWGAQQAGMQQAAMQQQQWRPTGQPPQMFGGGNVSGFGMQPQQQQQMALQQSQFGGFVSASNPQQMATAQPSQHQQQAKSFGTGGGGGFNWGTNVPSSSQQQHGSVVASSASTSVQTSTASSSARMGWSTNLAKQAPSSSGWGSSSGNATSDPTGWSMSLQNVPAAAPGGGGWGGGGIGMSARGGGGWGGGGGMSAGGGWGGGGMSAGGGGGWVSTGGWGGAQPQQQQNWGTTGNQPSNPFTLSPQTHQNPFL